MKLFLIMVSALLFSGCSPRGTISGIPPPFGFSTPFGYPLRGSAADYDETDREQKRRTRSVTPQTGAPPPISTPKPPVRLTKPVPPAAVQKPPAKPVSLKKPRGATKPRRK
jgi:hypothetical protein